MSERRKKGDIVAIIASLVIGLLMVTALIYGSEHRRKRDLIRLHEKALKAAQSEPETRSKEDSDDGQSSSKTQPTNTGGKKVWTPSTDDLNSFGQVIRTMPNDPNTPLLAPDVDDDSTSDRKESRKGSETGTSSKNSENEDQSDNSSGSDGRSSSTGSSSGNTSTSSTGTNTSSSTVRSNPPVPPKSENIVIFEPPKPNKEAAKLEEELQAARKRILELTNKESEMKQALMKKEAPPQQLTRRSRSRNIIFDPVPGLFPKIFVNRFFKQRKVQVIVHGPNNSKKEFRFNGGGGDEVNKLLQTGT